jgi:hypothetical protein
MRKEGQLEGNSMADIEPRWVDRASMADIEALIIRARASPVVFLMSQGTRGAGEDELLSVAQSRFGGGRMSCDRQLFCMFVIRDRRGSENI